MEWTIIYLIVIITGFFSFVLLFTGKLIPEETKKKLNNEELKLYRNNLLLVSLSFTISGILFLIQHNYNIKNLLIYLPIILLSWFGVKKLIANINLLNKK